MLYKYLGRKVTEEVNWEMVRMAMMSVAKTAIIPLQDILGLGQESRMNEPGRTSGNWQWRMALEQLTEAVQNRLTEVTITYGRA